MIEDKVFNVHKPFTFNNQVLFVDGMPGCGKTLLSSILGGYPRVELLSYCLQIEMLCGLHYLGRMDLDSTKVMIQHMVDLNIYEQYMARNTNFRWGDLSSVSRNARFWRYIARMFNSGDEEVPERVFRDKPILNYACHHLLSYSEPIEAALKERAVFIEVIRHPLYQVRQHYLNTQRIYGPSARSANLSYTTKGGVSVPYFVKNYEDQWVRGNAMDKAIISIYYWTKEVEAFMEKRKKYASTCLIVPFELFVLKPWSFISEIEDVLDVKQDWITRRVIKKQKVPRGKIADGIALPIYKRCGWEPAKEGLSEREELELRRNDAKSVASSSSMKLLDEISELYEERYLKDIL